METDKVKIDRLNKGKQQLYTSKGNIDLKKRTTNEEITAIKIKNEKIEKERRDSEEIERQQR